MRAYPLTGWLVGLSSGGDELFDPVEIGCRQAAVCARHYQGRGQLAQHHDKPKKLRRLHILRNTIVALRGAALLIRNEPPRSRDDRPSQDTLSVNVITFRGPAQQREWNAGAMFGLPSGHRWANGKGALVTARNGSKSAARVSARRCPASWSGPTDLNPRARTTRNARTARPVSRGDARHRSG